jgi:hypothetical protein
LEDVVAAAAAVAVAAAAAVGQWLFSFRVFDEEVEGKGSLIVELRSVSSWLVSIASGLLCCLVLVFALMIESTSSFMVTLNFLGDEWSLTHTAPPMFQACSTSARFESLKARDLLGLGES